MNENKLIKQSFLPCNYCANFAYCCEEGKISTNTLENPCREQEGIYEEVSCHVYKSG